MVLCFHVAPTCSDSVEKTSLWSHHNQLFEDQLLIDAWTHSWALSTPLYDTGSFLPQP